MKISLPNFSWKTMRDLLTTIPWAVTPKEIVVAGTMDAEGTISLPQEPARLTEEWKNEVTELDLSEEQVQVCRQCLKVVIPKQVLFVNKFSTQLVGAFIQ